MIDMLTWMHNIGIAILTILISVAIFIIQDKRRLDWDDLVILDKVVEARRLSISLFCIFIPVLLWDSNAELSWKHVSIFILFLAGTAYCLKILFSSYKWIRAIEIEDLSAKGSYRTRLRFECLREIKDFEEKKKIWALTWGREIKDLFERLALQQVFLNELQQLQERNLKGFHDLLRIFLNHLDKRKVADWREFDALFPTLLDWYHIMSGERYESKDPKSMEDFGLIMSTQHVLSELIKQCVIEAVKGNCAYPLFENLKKHVAPFSGKESKAKDQRTERYLGNLFSTFCPIFFENIGLSPESNYIWQGGVFPDNWKITTSTLKDSFIAKAWWVEFCRWGRERIFNVKKSDYDEPLEIISRELFPETDPILWADVLRFLFTPWVNDQRVKSVLNAKSNFGFIGRTTISDAEWTPEVDLSEETVNDKLLFNNTVALAFLVGGNNFNTKNLKKYLNEISSYTDNPHSAQYKCLFEAMLSKLNSEENTKTA